MAFASHLLYRPAFSGRSLSCKWVGNSCPPLWTFLDTASATVSRPRACVCCWRTSDRFSWRLAQCDRPNQRLNRPKRFQLDDTPPPMETTTTSMRKGHPLRAHVLSTSLIDLPCRSLAFHWTPKVTKILEFCSTFKHKHEAKCCSCG